MPTIEEARSWYDPNDPVHGFDHAMRVLQLVERIGREMGADMEILRAAALLHDAADAAPAEDGGRLTHEQRSAEFAARVLQDEGWKEDRIRAVQHCIRSHRYRGDERPQTLEAKILFDADKLDVVGAFGVARTIGYALQAGQPMFAEPSQRFLKSDASEKDEPHSAYHEYLFKLRRVKDRLYTQIGRSIAEKRNQVLTEFFEQLAAEARGEG